MEDFVITAGVLAAAVVGARQAVATAVEHPQSPAKVAAAALDAPMQVAGLKPLGTAWEAVNPYRGDANAIAVGKSASTENCARCHGMSAISGGIAPDLRYLPAKEEGDAIFSERVQKGAVRDGRVLMPPMAPTLGQPTLWAIRSWLDTVHQE